MDEVPEAPGVVELGVFVEEGDVDEREVRPSPELADLAGCGAEFVVGVAVRVLVVGTAEAYIEPVCRDDGRNRLERVLWTLACALAAFLADGGDGGLRGPVVCAEKSDDLRVAVPGGAPELDGHAYPRYPSGSRFCCSEV